MYKLSFIVIAAIFFIGCESEIIIPAKSSFELSFVKQGKTEITAGTTFFVKNTGSGEFVTLYDGNAGAVWGETGAKGVPFNLADSLPVLYKNKGKYNLTILTTSATKFGKDTLRDVKTVEVSVVDERNEILAFSIKDVNQNTVSGIISTNDTTITISIPDNNLTFSFAPTFVLNSTLSKVQVNGVDQVSATTVQNFAPPAVLNYRVISDKGIARVYKVKVVTYPASPENKLFTLQLGPAPTTAGTTIYSAGEIAQIDEVNKKISLSLNYVSKTNGPKIILTSSPYSTVYIYVGTTSSVYSSTKNYNLATITSVKVVAQNGTASTYSFSLGAQQNPLLSFKFIGLIPEPTATIDPIAKTATINVIKGTDITKLIASWTGSLGAVKIGIVDQTSGVTTNDFSTPKVYTFYKGTIAGDSYTVTVNVVN